MAAKKKSSNSKQKIKTKTKLKQAKPKEKKKNAKTGENSTVKTSKARLKNKARTAKKSLKQDKKKKFATSYISLWIIGAILLAYGSFYGYKLYEQNTLDNYNSAVYEVQVNTSKKMSKLNPLFQEFVVAPNVAKKLAPKFKQASDIARRTALGLATINPPNDYKSKHNALIKTYKDSSVLYNDLYKLSNYIVARDKVLKSFIKELKNFSNKISETKKKREALDVASEAEKKIKQALDNVNRLESPISFYDENLLTKYTKTLAKHLREFQDALNKKNRYKIELALYNIQVDYSQSWQKAFFKTDKQAIARYDKRVKKIETLYEEITN